MHKRLAINAALWCLLVLVLALPACGGAESEEAEAPDRLEKGLSKLEEDDRIDFERAIRLQQEALEVTADVVADAGNASVEELEQAMADLNGAYMFSRAQGRLLRSAGRKLKGRAAMLDELRQGNEAIQAAFAKLVEHHPNPSPSVVTLGEEK